MKADSRCRRQTFAFENARSTMRLSRRTIPQLTRSFRCDYAKPFIDDAVMFICPVRLRSPAAASPGFEAAQVTAAVGQPSLPRAAAEDACTSADSSDEFHTPVFSRCSGAAESWNISTPPPGGPDGADAERDLRRLRSRPRAEYLFDDIAPSVAAKRCRASRKCAFGGRRCDQVAILNPTDSVIFDCRASSRTIA